MARFFKELDQLQNLLQGSSLPSLKTYTLAEIQGDRKSYPLLGFTLGNQDPQAPTLVLIAGVHGLEKIGTQVLLASLSTLFSQLTWDRQLQDTFKQIRLVSIPILNPGGMARFRRSNLRGVDLMRNAPIEAENQRRPILIGGHRIGPHLPWYRGRAEDGLEVESQALVDFVSTHALCSQVCLAIDFHSGFGMRDRLWYPFAKTTKPFPKTPEVLRFKNLLERTYPHHVYKIEAQSENYTTHGDLWDYLYEIHEKTPEFRNHLFLPWTLEMGSWVWLKKNPLQIFNPLGLFHPIKGHRFDRVMRRHLLLVDFFIRAVANTDAWRRP